MTVYGRRKNYIWWHTSILTWCPRKYAEQTRLRASQTQLDQSKDKSAEADITEGGWCLKPGYRTVNLSLNKDGQRNLHDKTCRLRIDRLRGSTENSRKESVDIITNGVTQLQTQKAYLAATRIQMHADKEQGSLARGRHEPRTVTEKHSTQ